MEKSREVQILEKYGAEEIKSYCLISNYGYRFLINGIKYDIRFWENCYGAYIGRWEIMPASRTEEGEPIPMDKALKKKIEDEFNSF